MSKAKILDYFFFSLCFIQKFYFFLRKYKSWVFDLMYHRFFHVTASFFFVRNLMIDKQQKMNKSIKWKKANIV